MKLFVSGLVNVETNLRIRSFPVTYYPMDYPFYGIRSDISGVGYNIAKAVGVLGDEVTFFSLIGKDSEAERIKSTLAGENINKTILIDALDTTPVSVVLYEPGNGGRRQVYCDLKDIQEKTIDKSAVISEIEAADICALCNINFNRELLPIAKQAGKTIATDVHVLSDIHDPFNRDFMSYADILFLSDEDLPSAPEEFLTSLKNEYGAKIIVIGLGSAGVIMYERVYDSITRLPAVSIGGVINTVGAGDALFSAFVHYYGKTGHGLDSLKRAEAFAALKIRHDGGSKGFADERAVDEVVSTYKF